MKAQKANTSKSIASDIKLEFLRKRKQNHQQQDGNGLRDSSQKNDGTFVTDFKFDIDNVDASAGENHHMFEMIRGSGE